MAIELVAARINALPPHELLKRVDHRLSLLVGGVRDLPDRQRTMRAAIAWSYDLLTADEQDLLRRLSVFAGGFTLGAAEWVMGEHVQPSPITYHPSPASVLDVVASLVDKSLIRYAETIADESRYVMLETVREFALERLLETGEAETVARRFAEWCVRFAEEAEHDNLRATLAWSISHGEAEVALRITGAIWFFWYLRGYLAEAGSWLNRAVALDGPAASWARVKALRGASGYARVRSDPQRATALAEQALALAQTSDYPMGVALALEALGEVAFDVREPDRAVALQTEALAMFHNLGDEFWAALTSTYLASIATYREDYAGAMAWSEDALARARRLGHPWSIANAIDTMGEAAFARGDHETAVTWWRECLVLYVNHGRSWDISFALSNFAALALVRDDPGRATRLFAAADAAMQAVEAVSSERMRVWFDAQVAAARAVLGDAAFDAEWELGHGLDLHDAIAQALAVDPRPEHRRVAGTQRGGNQFGLSTRELDVLRLIADGRTDQQIADALFISRRTVTSHVSNILNKLSADNRAAALAKAIRHQLI